MTVTSILFVVVALFWLALLRNEIAFRIRMTAIEHIHAHNISAIDNGGQFLDYDSMGTYTGTMFDLTVWMSAQLIRRLKLEEK
jgi:hypothetical protein